MRPNKPKSQSLEQRKVYCRAKQGEWVTHAQKNLNSPIVFWGEVFIGKIWGEGCRACDFLLIGLRTGQCSRHLVLSLKLPSSTWLGVLVLQKNSRYCYVYSLRRNQDPAPRLHYCFLIAPPLSLYSLPSLIRNCLNLPFGTQGRLRRLNEAYFLQTRNGGH